MKFSYTKNMESEFFFIKKPNLTKKKKSGRWEGRGWGVARVKFYFLFSKESKSEKKNFFLRG